MPETSSILILSLENGSLGTLETFWSQGYKPGNRVFREIQTIFQKLSYFWRNFENPQFFNVLQNVLMRVNTGDIKNLTYKITLCSHLKI